MAIPVPVPMASWDLGASTPPALRRIYVRTTVRATATSNVCVSQGTSGLIANKGCATQYHVSTVAPVQSMALAYVLLSTLEISVTYSSVILSLITAR